MPEPLRIVTADNYLPLEGAWVTPAVAAA